MDAPFSKRHIKENVITFLFNSVDGANAAELKRLYRIQYLLVIVTKIEHRLRNAILFEMAKTIPELCCPNYDPTLKNMLKWGVQFAA